MNGLNIGRRLLVIALAIAVAAIVAVMMLTASSQPFDGMNTGHKDPGKPGPTAPACGVVGKYKKHPTPTCTK